VSSVWVVVAAVGLGTVAIKALGPVLLGGRPLPERVAGPVSFVAPALLAALVATQTFGAGRSLVLDDRVVGLAASAIAVWLRAPILVVIVVAASATSLVRFAT
jgi:branched-subunit amino acid transport protein